MLTDDQDIPDEEEECPKCPPVGSPAWMATFADISTLLMAFFVLILAFAEFNVPKFKMLSGSMRESFGVQREIPEFDVPKGTTVLSLDFSPSPNMSVTKELTQQTTEREQPELDLKTSNADTDQERDTSNDSDISPEELLKALDKATRSGEIALEVTGKEATSEVDQDAELSKLVQRTAEALEAAQANIGDGDSDMKLEKLLVEIARITGIAEKAAMLSANSDSPETQRENAQAKTALEKATQAAADLTVALGQEISSGLVFVENRKEKVVVTVGAGGAFPSGSAKLTAEAKDIMTRIAFASMGGSSNISVAGHTDDRPIHSGGKYFDNWDLAAARSASVVRQINSIGLVDQSRITAISFGETRPVSDNETPAGREKNRRIEIEISY